MRIPSRRRVFALHVGLLVLASCPIAGWMHAREPDAPGLHDLVVYDPGTHERGLPAVEMNPAGEGFKVDIPPAVHVHRYYYSGDKEIQGPIIAGGPTVVVANHPTTGERLYVDVMLPSGAPRIAYDKHCITYVYPTERVAIHFCHFPFSTGKVVVKYQSGKGVTRTAHEAAEKITQKTKQNFRECALVQTAKRTGDGASDVLHGTKVGFTSLTSGAVDKIGSSLTVVPGVNYLKSLGQQAPQRQYTAEVQAAARAKDHHAPVFVPTNR